MHFAPGQYQPDSQEGQELIGHELAHVVQQKQGRVKPDAQQNKGGINLNTDASLEKEADEAGVKAAQAKTAEIKGKGSGVQRQGIDSSMRINIGVSSESDLTYRELIDDNINTSLAILLNYIMALQNFETVVNSASKKETESKSVGETALKATAKFVFDLLVDHTLENIPGAKQVYDLSRNIINDIQADQKRALAAVLSNSIGEFIINHRIALVELRSQLKSNQVNIVSTANRECNIAGDSYKSILRNLAINRNNYLTQAQQGTHSIVGLFGKIGAEWINSSSDTHGVLDRQGFILVGVDENWNITNAHIHAPRGQRIAEQLLSSNFGPIDLIEVGVRFRLNFCNKIYFDFEGVGDSGVLSYNKWATQDDMNIFLGHYKEKGIPSVAILTGDE